MSICLALLGRSGHAVAEGPGRGYSKPPFSVPLSCTAVKKLKTNSDPSVTEISLQIAIRLTDWRALLKKKKTENIPLWYIDGLPRLPHQSKTNGDPSVTEISLRNAYLREAENMPRWHRLPRRPRRTEFSHGRGASWIASSRVQTRASIR